MGSNLRRHWNSVVFDIQAQFCGESRTAPVPRARRFPQENNDTFFNLFEFHYVVKLPLNIFCLLKLLTVCKPLVDSIWRLIEKS